MKLSRNYKSHLIMFSKRLNKDSILAFLDSHIIDYPTPINLNYLWSLLIYFK
jgi:hypothetical protein